MTYAVLADVQARYEQVIPADLTTFVQSHLDDAHALLDALIPSLAAGVTSGDVAAALPRMAVVQAVLRVLRNPAGVKGEHAGEVGYYFDQGGAAQGRVAFLDEELALLQPSGRRGRLRSVGLDDDALCEPVRRGWFRQDVEQDWTTGDILYNHAQQD